MLADTSSAGRKEKTIVPYIRSEEFFVRHFSLAVDDDLIRKNPFQFQLMEVVVNDSVTREAISRA